MKLITTESVSFGHPDKIADQISDLLLDAYLTQDDNSKVAIETMVKDNMVIISGEVKSNAIFNPDPLIRNMVKEIGYTDPEHGFYYKNLSILNIIGKQSNEINMAVDGVELGSGDQGFMIGYATNDTENYMPIGMYVSRKLVDYVVNEPLLGPDCKSQTTIEYDNDNCRIHTILISVMHRIGISVDCVRTSLINDIKENKMKLEDKIFKLIDDDTKIVINPAGTWNVGGPVSDCGVTGRKIVVDQYGPYCPVGGGAFCFAGDTLVKMNNGYKQISLIEKDDLIWTYNVNTNKLELKTVNNIFSKSSDDSYDMLELVMENDEIIKITENHEVKTKNGWKKAKDLNINDEILDFSFFVGKD